MIIKITKLKRMLGAVSLSAFILSAQVAIASPTSGSPTTPKTLQVQNFTHDQIISVQFRYVDKNLRFVRIENLTDKPLIIHALDDNYVLGGSDSIILDPPNVEYVVIGYEPYYEIPTVMNTVLPDRFVRYFYYELPEQKEPNHIVAEGGLENPQF